MQIKWLEDFVSLSRQRSFTRSAEERQVTLPAFGRRIKTLESWVGVPLINRGSYPATLTVEGDFFLETAREVLAKLQDSRSALRARSLAGEDSLHVATGRTLAHIFFPELIEQARRRIGTFNVHVSTGSVHDMALLLEDGRADILLSFFHPDIGVNLSEKDFQCLVAAQEVLIPVCKPDASGKQPLFRLPGTQRRPLPLLSYLPTLMMGKVLDRHLLKKADSYRLQRVLVGDFAEALLEHAFHGEGIAWLPQRLAADALRAKRLVHAGCPADEIPLEVRLYCHQKNLKPLVAKLWHSLSGTHFESPVTAKA